MSAGYTSILWNRQKKIYDRGIVLVILTFIVLYGGLHVILFPSLTFETLFIRTFGLLAFALLHIVLIIGPLSRLNSKFLILLYNRRHLGVTMFLMALLHGGFSIMNFHSLSNTHPIRSVFTSNLDYTSLTNFPFQTLGFFALIILAFMAATSHDFWLKNLGPKTWKSLHMLVYVAYALIILHVVLGAVQDQPGSGLFIISMLGFGMVVSLHLMAAFKEMRKDRSVRGSEWVKACTIDDIKDTRARIVTLNGERVAIFKYDQKLSAVNNFCRHQGGPLGEGKVIDGCITCPWHGYQYYPHNGQSPPPFTEKVETYELKLDGNEVWINPVPHPEGTEVEPLKIR